MKRRSVTRIRSTVDGEYDDNGDPTPLPDGEDPSTLEITGCLVAPRYSTEPTEAAQAGVIVGKTLYAPPGSDIVRTDQFEIDGQRFDVEGEPGLWDGTSAGGLEVALKRAAG